MSGAYLRLVDALQANGSIVKDTGQGKAQAQCPSHDDGNPSLSIGPRRDGKGVVVTCHAGCDYRQVLDAIGLSPRDLFDDDALRDAYNTKADYRYPDGRIVHCKPDKQFPQSGNTKGRALFHADRINDAEIVYVPEGEKDVLAIEAAGGVAVCSALGAGKAHLADWSPLAGLHVIIIADRDEAGRRHAAQIGELLAGIAASVQIVEAAAGKDAADHIAHDRTLAELAQTNGHRTSEDTGGAELLDDLHDTFTKYVAFPDHHCAVGATLWTAVTHALPAFECAPRLVADSPQKRCGKTRLLDIITGTCHNPLATVNATVAAIFRSLTGDHPPTLIIDEADTLFGSKKAAEQNEDFRALLNAGHQRGRPRCAASDPCRYRPSSTRSRWPPSPGSAPCPTPSPTAPSPSRCAAAQAARRWRSSGPAATARSSKSCGTGSPRGPRSTSRT
jgi:5S rRNA maturation endonuclease (ribonuclease M5)